ncbi:MAG TPA: hypothetical protein PK397_00075 [Ignavibacteriaceae bacterium]|jgi:uncharacterized membrane protein|nr:hypothetical protein [Ignavibacteriaceae bacterium]
MTIYAILKLLHVLSSVVWLGLIPADYLLRKYIASNKGKEPEGTLITVWLKVVNLSGMIGLTGVLVTGIVLSITLGYGFFQFSSGGNHWLYTKQFIMLIIMILVGGLIIPRASKISKIIKNGIGENKDTVFYSNLNKLYSQISIQNGLIFINFILAFTRLFV